jgi:hypothetical protein
MQLIIAALMAAGWCSAAPALDQNPPGPMTPDEKAAWIAKHAAAPAPEDGDGAPGLPGDAVIAGNGAPYSVQPCGNGFVDISGSGTLLPNASNSDDNGDVFPIGFTFNYFGDDHTMIGADSNGYLTFGGILSDFTNDPIPSPNDPDNLIAPYWDDWNPAAVGEVYRQLSGSAPNRVLIVQWNNVRHFNSASILATFEALLFEGSNCIEFRYGSPLGVHSPSVGIENQNGTVGIMVPTPSAGFCVRFCPPDLSRACCWPDGTCFDAPVATCELLGGQPAPTGADCDDPGFECRKFEFACCFEDGVCLDISPLACLAGCGIPLKAHCDEVTCDQPRQGDANYDGVVDIFDLTEVLGRWGGCEPDDDHCPPHPCGPDFDRTGLIDVKDLLTVLNSWG